MHKQFDGLRNAMRDMHMDVKTELSGLRGDFRAELGELRSDFRAELGELRSGFHSELGELRNEFRGEVAGVRSEIAYMRGRFDVLIWAVGINAAATIAILGVLLRH